MDPSSEPSWSHLWSDRVITIAGSTGGIGRAVAGLAVQVGARTAVIGRDRHEIDEIANILAGGPGEIVAVVSDVRDHRSVICAAEAVEQRFGHIDALVYCVRFGAVADVMESTLADQKTMMDVNHFGRGSMDQVGASPNA